MEIVKQTKNKGGNPNWHKGVSGNPHGRPRKEECITNIAREMLGQVCPFDAEKRTWAQYLAYRLLSQSIENIGSLRELLERLEGKITQPIAATGDTVVHFTIGKGYDDS